MRKTEELSIDQLEDLMLAIHENANNLTMDARILLKEHRFARAYAIAELGAEELGKLLVVGGIAVQVAAKQPVSWRRFWRRFRDHSPKAWNIALLDFVYDQKLSAWLQGDVLSIKADEAGIAEAQRQAGIMPLAKNRALYVDWHKGRLRRPDESIPADWAQQMADAVTELASRMAERGMPPEKGWLAARAASPDRVQRVDEINRRLADVGEPPSAPT